MTAAEIVSTVAERHGLQSPDLRRTARHPRRNIDARHEAMAAIRKDLGWTYEQIGRYFGGYHHTSVLNGVRRYLRRVPARHIRSEIDELRTRVRQLEQIVAGCGLMGAPE